MDNPAQHKQPGEDNLDPAGAHIERESNGDVEQQRQLELIVEGVRDALFMLGPGFARQRDLRHRHLAAHHQRHADRAEDP